MPSTLHVKKGWLPEFSGYTREQEQELSTLQMEVAELQLQLVEMKIRAAQLEGEKVRVSWQCCAVKRSSVVS